MPSYSHCSQLVSQPVPAGTRDMAVKPKQGQCADKPDYHVSPEQHPLVNTVVTECMPAHTILYDAVSCSTPCLVQLQSPASPAVPPCSKEGR